MSVLAELSVRTDTYACVVNGPLASVVEHCPFAPLLHRLYMLGVKGWNIGTLAYLVCDGCRARLQ